MDELTFEPVEIGGIVREVKAGLVSIYVLIDPRDGEIRYVGQTTKSLSSRLKRHVSDTRNQQDSYRLRWLRELARHGYQPLIHEVQAVPASFYAEAERYWITYYRAIGCALVNGTDGGDGCPGYVPTDATRRVPRDAAFGAKAKAARLAERLSCPSCSMVTNAGCLALHRKASGH